MTGPFELTSDPKGTVFFVRVSPGSSRSKILGEHGGALKVGVNAPPEKGKANAALLKLLAKKLEISKKDLSIITGETAKTKRVLLEGKNTAQTAALLHKAAGL